MVTLTLWLDNFLNLFLPNLVFLFNVFSIRFKTMASSMEIQLYVDAEEERVFREQENFP